LVYKLLIFLILVCTLQAEEKTSLSDYLSTEKIILLNETNSSKNAMYIYKEYKIINDNLYKLTFNQNSRINRTRFELTKISIEDSTKQDKYDIKYEKLREHFEVDKSSVIDYFVNEEYLLLNFEKGNSYLCLFAFDGKEYVFHKVIKAPYIFQFTKLENNNIIAFNSVSTFTNKSAKSQTYFYTHDISTGVETIHFLKNPEYILSSFYSAYKFIDYHSGLIALSSGEFYDIRLYNKMGEEVSQISRSLPKKVVPIEVIYGINNERIIIIDSIATKIINSNGASPEYLPAQNTVHFLDSNFLLVNYRIENNLNNSSIVSLIDIWKKEGNKWELFMDSVPVYNNSDDDIFSMQNISIAFPINIDGYYIKSLIQFPFEYNKSFELMTFWEVRRMAEKHNQENRKRQSLIIRHLNLKE